MSDLFAYLKCDGPEYDYLGHFREREYLEMGHNDIEGDINAGRIPSIHTGSNVAAQTEPSSIANAGNTGMSGAGASAYKPASGGAGSSALAKAFLGGSGNPGKDFMSGVGSGLAGEQDFSGGEGAAASVGDMASSAGQAVGGAIGGLFGL